MSGNTVRITGPKGIITRMFVAAVLPAFLLLGSCGKQQERAPHEDESLEPVTRSGSSSREQMGGGCEGCELMYDGMPSELNWQTEIADSSEPGDRMEIEGTIYQTDGRTPAPDVILYVYHTDAGGYYVAPEGRPVTRHGHLRGWMKTNAGGAYRFTSIRPAPYPEGIDPAHIHPIVKEPGRKEYYIDEYVFDDDTLVNDRYRMNRESRGGSGTIHLTKGRDGVWRGRRDITLGKNIPGYR